ncbi:MAG: AraC family transcriptional regulator, partial [Perlucidibaca sp.]
KDIREHQRFFACPLSFDADENAIAFPIGVMELALLQPNPPLMLMLDEVCDRLLARLQSETEPDWLQQCRRAIVESLRGDVPVIERIAPVLGLSPRALRRKLTSSGLSFRDLVDDLRRDLAQRYIKDHELSLVDIAFLLGFSQQSAFQRAFRRWTGEAPGQRRRQLTMLGGDAPQG